MSQEYERQMSVDWGASWRRGQIWRTLRLDPMLLAIIALASVIGSVSLTRKLRRERFTFESEIPQSALHPDLSHARWKIFLGHMPLV